MFAKLRSNSTFQAVASNLSKAGRFANNHPNLTTAGLGAGAIGMLAAGHAFRQPMPGPLDAKIKAYNKRYWTDSPEWEKYRFDKNVRWQRDAGSSLSEATKFVKNNPDFWKVGG